MADAGMCAGIQPLLGVYLTGAIAPADRAVVVHHLAACAGCRTELAGLAGLPGLLRRPPVYAAAQALGEDDPALDNTAPENTTLDSTVPKYPAPDEAGAGGVAVPGRLVRRMMRRRRRRRRLLAVAAFALAAGAGVGWALQAAGLPAPGPDT